jgi:bacterioferritin
MDLLNKGIARELQVSIQYMWQHILAKGVESVAVEDIFREIAIAEMKHAEACPFNAIHIVNLETSEKLI